MNLGSYSTAIIYALGAVVTVVLLIAGHHPQLWRVNLVPENTVQPGDDVLVPVGSDFNHRRMRVMQMLGHDVCLAVDIKDQQHHNAMAVGMAVSWPIMLPFVVVAAVYSALVTRQTARHQASAMQHPRPKGEPVEGVPTCMRGHEWTP